MVTITTMELYHHDMAGFSYYIYIEHKYHCKLSISSTSDSDSPIRVTPYQQIKAPTTKFPINSKQQLHTCYINSLRYLCVRILQPTGCMQFKHSDCPTVPLWAGQSRFQKNCPTSRTNLIRDAVCPALDTTLARTCALRSTYSGGAQEAGQTGGVGRLPRARHAWAMWLLAT